MGFEYKLKTKLTDQQAAEIQDLLENLAILRKNTNMPISCSGTSDMQKTRVRYLISVLFLRRMVFISANGAHPIFGQVLKSLKIIWRKNK